MDENRMIALRTRREVRSFLARGLADLTGANEHLPVELADISTATDHDIVLAHRRLDEFCAGRGREVHPTYTNVVLGRQMRDLFAAALLKMQQLPPDQLEGTGAA